MTDYEIYSRLFLLKSNELKQDLVDYLDFLPDKQFSKEESKTKRIPKFGSAKGKFKMTSDFNEPIDHFKDYVPE